MNNNIFYNLYNGISTNKPFLYEYSYMEESKEKNFINIISSKGKSIGNKDYDESILNSYDKKKYSEYISYCGDVTIYPKELDLLNNEEIQKLSSQMGLESWIQRFKLFNIETLTSEIKHEIIEDNIGGVYTFCTFKFKLKPSNDTKTIILNVLKESFKNSKCYFGIETKFLNLIIEKYESFENNEIEYFEINELEGVDNEAINSGLIYLLYTGYIDMKVIYQGKFEIKILRKNTENRILKVSDKLTPEILKLIEDKNISETLLLRDKKGELKMIERTHHIDSKNNTYAGLKNKYKFGEVKSKIHDSKDKTYIVKEKIRIEKKK